MFSNFNFNSDIESWITQYYEMYQCHDSMPKIFYYETNFQGLAGTSYTFFNNDNTNAPTPQMLHRAVLKGDIPTLKRCLNSKVPVDVRDEVGEVF